MSTPKSRVAFQFNWPMIGSVVIVLVLLLGLGAIGLLTLLEVQSKQRFSEQVCLISIGIGLAISFPIAAAQVIAKSRSLSSHRLTVSSMAIIAIPVAFGLLFFVTEYGFSHRRGAPDIFLFLIATGALISGIAVYSFVQHFAPSWIGGKIMSEPEKLIQKRFSLLESMVLVACVCVLLGLLLKQEIFPPHLLTTYGLQILISFGISLGAHLLIVLPMTVWLTKARPYWLAALTLIVLSFVAAQTFCIVVDSILKKPFEWSVYASVLLTTTCFTFTYSVWTKALQLATEKNVESVGPSIGTTVGLGKIAKYIWYTVTFAVCIFGIGWCAVHFLVGG